MLSDLAKRLGIRDESWECWQKGVYFEEIYAIGEICRRIEKIEKSLKQRRRKNERKTKTKI